MNKILKNEIIYIVLNDKYIIKCIRIGDLRPIDDNPVYDSNFASYYCDESIVIEICDNKKNIINSINVPEYKYLLKKDSIISLKNFNKEFTGKCYRLSDGECYISPNKNIYFKTYLRAFMHKNIINNIFYFIDNNGKIYGFENDILELCCTNILELKNLTYDITVFNQDKLEYILFKNCKEFKITYYLYDEYYYQIHNYDNKINISRLKKNKKENIYYQQTIICNDKLQILQLLDIQCDFEKIKILYEENRDDTNKIINIKKYNYDTDKLETIVSDDNNKSHLIKINETFSQELLDFYNLNINYDLNKLDCLKNKELCNALKILVNEIMKYSLLI